MNTIIPRIYYFLGKLLKPFPKKKQNNEEIDRIILKMVK